MPYTTQSSDFWGWYLRHNDRIVWKHLQDAGMDLFSSGPSNNTQAFLDLTNVCPAVNGGFNFRWGHQGLGPTTSTTAPFNATISRVFPYNYPQLSSDPSDTANTNIWMFTDDQNFGVMNDNFTAFTGHGPSNFANPGYISACTSRGWFYYGNNLVAPRKVNPSYTTANTDSLIGIAIPQSNSFPSNVAWLNYPNVNFSQGLNQPVTIAPLSKTIYGGTTGYGYSSLPTFTITDPTGAGSGATMTATLGANGELYHPRITANGTAYAQAVVAVSGGGSPTTVAQFVLYVQTNSAAPQFGEVVGVDTAGQMSFIQGRRYAVALQNSLTGHTSDVYTTNAPITPRSGQILDFLTQSYTASELAVGTTIPVYSASTGVTAGFTQIETVIVVPQTNANVVPLDPQVDTVILLAAADGQSLGTLYQVAIIPLSSFTLSGGSYYYYYVDTLPDSYNSTNVTGDTLLEADLWAYTDSTGDEFGILLNTPPTPTGFLYPTQHLGRLFATDGKTVFFSKSLDEVTTSTGLITSKWEECWPGDYQLPMALNNETILGQRSDGTNLHVGTDKSMFTVYGSDPSNFSVPSVAFAQTGILSNDLWAVIYAEGIPSGFVWVTQDFKVIHSDFSTYHEIGTPVYPIFQNLDPAKVNQHKACALTQGPYNFVFFELYLTGQTAPVFMVWDTRLGKWYRWKPAAGHSGTGFITSAAFVYQFPANTASVTFTPGSKYLFFPTFQTSGNQFTLDFFNPNAFADLSSSYIPWNIQTSWQDCGDSTSIKTCNEIEVVGDNAPYTVTLYGASSQSGFDSPNVLKTGTTVTGPIGLLASNKFYCAGANTTAKYYSVQISGSTGVSPSSASALTAFSLEQYPMARI